MLNKTLVSLAIGTVISSVSTASYSALPPKALLSFDNGNVVTTCLLGTTPPCSNPAFNVTDIGGTYFSMDADGSGSVQISEKTPISMKNGIILGVVQDATGNHTGAPTGTEDTNIDLAWNFFGNTGLHRTPNTAITISAGDDGTGDGTATLDFSGWTVAWSDVDAIPMGGDTANFPTDTGLGTMKCYSTSALRDAAGAPDGSCAAGEFYALDYAAHVPVGDPSMFGGVPYVLYMVGQLSDTNTAPVAASDPLVVNEATGSTFMINLATNVSDSDGVDNTSFQLGAYSGSRSPAPTLAVGSTGIVTYTDNEGTDTTSSDTFTYTVADSLGLRSSPYTVNVNLTSGNIPPSAQNFSVTTDKNLAILVDVAANATDVDGTIDATTVATSTPVNGAVTNIDAVTGIVTFEPTSGFTGVASFNYTVNDDAGTSSNSAKVTVNVNNPPVAGDTSVSVDRNSSVEVDVVALTSDTDGTVVATTVSASNGMDGTTSVNATNGRVTYTPTAGFAGMDQFTYTIKDNTGTTSNLGTVTVTVSNAPPTAVDDNATLDTSLNASVGINVTTNDTDSDGTIDVTSVNITTNPASGSAVADATGVITYTPSDGFVGTDTLKYTVNDNDGATSNEATVSISVSSGAEFCQNAPLSPSSCFLVFNPGKVTGEVSAAVGDGSWFSMQVKAEPALPLVTPITALNNLQLNTSQPASSVPLVANIDQPWNFFGNLGVHQTTSTATVTSDDGAGNVTLDFSGWDVSWNGIASIPLGSGAHSGGVNGVAVMTCYSDNLVTLTPGDCSAGNAYVLDYRATVPSGDPSGFGGVKYTLHLEGLVSPLGTVFMPATPPNTTTIQAINSDGTTLTLEPGSTAAGLGNTTGTGLTAAQTGVGDPLLNTADGQQCLGGCVDFVVTGATEYVDIVIHLDAPLVSGAIYRKLINNVWRDFDASGQDSVASNAEDVSGACTDDTFTPGLTSGNKCILLRIYDGGTNDADGVVNGTIVDPSGVLVAGSPNTPPGENSGCSISDSKVDLTQRADWLVVGGFIAWLGIVLLRRKKTLD